MKTRFNMKNIFVNWKYDVIKDLSLNTSEKFTKKRLKKHKTLSICHKKYL